MGISTKNKLTVIFVAAIVVAILVFFAICMVPKVDRRNDLAKRKAELKAQIEETSGKANQIKRDTQMLQTNPEFIEKTAREKQGRVKPGEVVFEFDDDDKDKK